MCLEYDSLIAEHDALMVEYEARIAACGRLGASDKLVRRQVAKSFSGKQRRFYNQPGTIERSTFAGLNSHQLNIRTLPAAPTFQFETFG